MDEDLKYLHDCLSAVDLVPFKWQGEDKNIGAFFSREALVAWYGQGPGIENEPYRDRGFYCRELAHISRILKPKTIVEFGTCQGIGTCLLHWLNPEAQITTVDINTETFIPGDIRVPVGYLAKLQKFQCNYVTGKSWDHEEYDLVDLCFIDADHSYLSVLKDSYRAWENKSNNWVIIWHDYNNRHTGLMQAVNEFCRLKGVKLQSREDSDTVWIMGEN